MKLPIIAANKIDKPVKGYAFAFIDEDDNKLKIRKHDSIVEFTNDLSDVQLLDLTDYTAFEVFAHDYDIPVGNCEELGGEVCYNELPASMQHQFTIRSNNPQNKQNVIIDWGDGMVEKLRDVIPTDNGGDYKYTCLHTYESNGKYIIKIYGDSYYGLIQGNGTQPNIICRILSKDLPVASHLNNFSSFARGSKHLLNVNINGCTNFINNSNNLSLLFQACTNLLSITGFYLIGRDNIACSQSLSNCYSLINTDFIILNPSYSNTFYNKCYKLSGDINYLLSKFSPVKGDTINVSKIFYECESLYGTVPAYKLWENRGVIWENTDAVFSKCSDEMRSQVPVSWGGTNKYIDDLLRVSDTITGDYTAIEVFAHDYDIPSGTIQEELGPYEIKRAITSGMVHSFQLRSLYDNTNSDVVIDWGDNSITEVLGISGNDLTGSSGEFKTKLSHRYNSSGKYLIKIYGKDYYNISHYTTNNIMCRIFDKDLPIASHLTDLRSFAANAKQLLYVNTLSCVNFNRINNISKLFDSCTNLLIANGLNLPNRNNLIYDGLFNGCAELIETDFILYPTIGSLESIFNNCKKLAVDIGILLNSFDVPINSSINVNQLFRYCSVMTGVVHSDKLWNRSDVTWLNTSNTFKYSDSSIRSQVPASWGGTASDDIIKDKTTFDISNKITDLKINTLYKADTKLMVCAQCLPGEKDAIITIRVYESAEQHDENPDGGYICYRGFMGKEHSTTHAVANALVPKGHFYKIEVAYDTGFDGAYAIPFNF